MKKNNPYLLKQTITVNLLFHLKTLKAAEPRQNKKRRIDYLSIFEQDQTLREMEQIERDMVEHSGGQIYSSEEFWEFLEQQFEVIYVLFNSSRQIVIEHLA